MTIEVNLGDKSSVKDAKEKIEAYKKWLQEKTQQLVDDCAEDAREDAERRYHTAIYSGDGAGSIEVHTEDNGKLSKTIIASGHNEKGVDITQFIEFGTGVVTSDDHPESGVAAYGRGEYGLGHGSNPDGWGYYGEPGNNAIHPKHARSANLYRTKGDPANMCMYNAKKGVELSYEDKAEEIFKGFDG